jgi:hypothetical protein
MSSIVRSAFRDWLYISVTCQYSQEHEHVQHHVLAHRLCYRRAADEGQRMELNSCEFGIILNDVANI